MIRCLKMFFAAGLAVALLVIAFNIWARAPRLTSAFARPDVAASGVRCQAVAVIAAAQFLILVWIVDSAYRSGYWGWLVRAGVGLVGSIALVCGIALGWAGH